MQNYGTNTKKPHLPRYVIVIFVIIVAIIGFGIGQKQYSPEKSVSLFSSPDNSLDNISLRIAPIPTIKPDAKEVKINANIIILLDSNSNMLLYGKDIQTRVPVASITKVMTSMVVIDKMDLNKVVEIKKEDTDVIGSVVGLKAGEKIKVIELLKAMLMKSGNDSAKALARATSGSESVFVSEMNKKAESLGLNDTKYMDPHGLSADAYSTAFNQAVLFNYALKNPTFKQIVSTAKVTIKAETGEEYEIDNSNRLVTDEMRYDGIIGGKTGFTYEAGHSLVSAASKNGHTLISVVLNTYSQAKEASAIESGKLLDWGFASYEWK